MANPQAEKGHTDIANEIVEAFCRYRMPGQEWQILWVIIRKTWGWKKKMDRISLSQIEEMTRIPRRKCHSLLKSLIIKNAIFKTPINNSRAFQYGIQKDYEQWQVFPKKGMFPNKVTKMSPIRGNTKENKEIVRKSFSDEDIRLTDLLIELLLKNDPKSSVRYITPRIREKWLEECQLLREKDGRSADEIEETIRFSQDDSFWKTVVLSMPTLRKRFTSLYLKLQQRDKDFGSNNLSPEEEFRRGLEENT